MVVLVGPDGSGKTTTADELEKLCNQSGWAVRRFHWRPAILPSRARLTGGNVSLDVTRPHASIPHGVLISCLMYVVYFLDFWLGFLLRLFPLLRRGTLVIYERYFYDVIYDPKRYRLKKNRSLSRALALLLPRPDLVVILGGEATVLHMRKPELPPDEILRQQETILTLFSHWTKALPLDVTRNNPTEVASAILQAL